LEGASEGLFLSHRPKKSRVILCPFANQIHGVAIRCPDFDIFTAIEEALAMALRNEEIQGLYGGLSCG
jgi:hypothetical protein